MRVPESLPFENHFRRPPVAYSDVFKIVVHEQPASDPPRLHTENAKLKNLKPQVWAPSESY